MFWADHIPRHLEVFGKKAAVKYVNLKYAVKNCVESTDDGIMFLVTESSI